MPNGVLNAIVGAARSPKTGGARLVASVAARLPSLLPGRRAADPSPPPDEQAVPKTLGHEQEPPPDAQAVPKTPGHEQEPPGDAAVIGESGLFLPDWYLAQNPDVAAAKADPVLHFLLFGAADGRDPHPLFDTSWYLQKYGDVSQSGLNPLVHYLRFGAAEGRDPSPNFDSDWYLETNDDVAKAGFNPLSHYVLHGIAEGRPPNPRAREPHAVPAAHKVVVVPAREVVRRRFDGLQPLRVYSAPGLPPRLTMVTDSINQGSLFGGVGTAMILATLLASRLGVGLRIVTRHQKADELNYRRVLAPNRIDWKRTVEFVHADIHDDAAQIDVGEDEIFLTTSWWTTWSVKHAIPEERIIYLLQEDERMFYPFGDDHLRCAEALGSRKLRYVINSELLYRHLVADGFDNIGDRGIWFEPSFPETHFYRDQERGDGRKNFLFYARPNNLRNLYHRGLEVVELAVARGILPRDEWNLHFVGKDLSHVAVAPDWVPTLHENLHWSDYAALLRSMDLGLSLMYTPHPSYPPLDLAACGAVAVTNKFGLKQSLDRYSRNILCTGLGTEELVSGLASGVALCGDPPALIRNYREQGLLRDWKVSFEPVLDKLGRG